MKTLKQRFVAKTVQISEPYLSQILSGVRRPSWEVAKRLAVATETDAVVWMEGADKIRAAIEKAEREKVRRLNEMADAQAEACAGGF